jgi:hypothetical protein
LLNKIEIARKQIKDGDFLTEEEFKKECSKLGEEVFDRILLSAKIEQALQQSEQGLGQDFDDFKEEWLSED